MLRRPAGWGTLVLVTALVAGCAVGDDTVLPDGSIGLPTADVGTNRHDAKEAGTAGDATVPLPDASAFDAAFDADADGALDGDASDDAVASETGSDAHVTTVDAGHDAGCPVGTTGPGCTACASGYHLCGATCTADGPNNPSTGCSTGCGTACPATGGEVASCTAGGTCTAGCPSGELMCSGTCAACCTDTDCPTNVTCIGGTCSGCATDYGTCNSLCDTDLTTNDNCGFCGDSCDTGFGGGCGFLGLGGCSCSGSGDPSNYSCQ